MLNMAVDIVRRRGPSALTMRALSEELGTTAPTIYWHVGNKEALLAGVTELIGIEIGEVKVAGKTPDARIRSIARSLADALRRNQHLAAFAYERGALFDLLAPARRALAEEFAAAGLHSSAIVNATNSVIKLVGDHQIALSVHGSHRPQRADSPLWEGRPPVGRETARRLAERYDATRTFEFTLRALVRGLLAT